MATLTIRRIDDDVKEALKLAAARDGRSVEGYVRNLINKEMSHDSLKHKRDLSAEIRDVMGINGVFLLDSEMPVRSETQRNVEL